MGLETPSGKHTIAIAVYGESKYLDACLASIKQNTPLVHEVCVVDTKSPRISLAAGWNKAVRQGTGEFCTMLNDDVLVAPGWLERLEQALLSDPEIGTVSPTLSACWGEQKNPYLQLAGSLDMNSATQIDVDTISAKIARAYAGQRKSLNFLAGCCLMFRRDLFEQLGGFDEDFFPIYGEDDDWCDRVIEAGYKCVWVMDAYVHHFYHKTAPTLPDLDRAAAKARLAMKRRIRAAQ